MKISVYVEVFYKIFGKFRVIAIQCWPPYQKLQIDQNQGIWTTRPQDETLTVKSTCDKLEK